ncbi:GNAT family N-acetyltransferase [Streptomyces sp. NPDC001262]|uniref:GNAT family N-acetyltransferase n=1 Tax=Streptomyces sp. NPDC001262 TaxID=3364552 RepID=UPI00367FAE1A
MTETDIPAVSAVRVSGWKAAYAGMIPQSYLDGMTVEADTALRRRQFPGSRGRMTDLVAVDSRDEVVGWACLGPDRDTGGREPATGELYALYVHPSLTGSGIGRTLLGAVHAHAGNQGLDSMLLWVLRDNVTARRFYERAGYASDGAVQSDDYDGLSVTEVRYHRALDRITQRPPAPR